MARGTWRGCMPGADRLAAQLGIGHSTMEGALHQLEDEGLLVPEGAGRRRRIDLSQQVAPPALRVGILLSRAHSEQHLNYMQELQHGLMEAGHVPFFAARTQLELGTDFGRISNVAQQTDADAWIVASGSRETLEWFAQQSIPTLALFGHGCEIPLARVGPDKGPAYAAATRRLIQLGHERIVLLARPQRLLPIPGAPEQAFLDELVAHGLATSNYNAPEWRDHKEGLHHILNALFRLTPPTALIVDEAFLLLTVQQHLAQQGILAPKHVSLVCTDPEDRFSWCEPSVAHTQWDSGPVIRQILHWVTALTLGRNERRQVLSKATFVNGGTVGPVTKAPAKRPCPA